MINKKHMTQSQQTDTQTMLHATSVAVGLGRVYVPHACDVAL